MGDIYDKMISVYGALRSSLDGRASMLVLADRFRPDSDYAKGSLVINDGKLYQCIEDHSAAAFDGSHFSETTIDEAIDYILDQRLAPKADRTDIAQDITSDEGVLHRAGELVWHDGELWRCTSQYTGAWIASNFERSDVNSVLLDKALYDDLSMNGEYVNVDDGDNVQLKDRTITVARVQEGATGFTVSLPFVGAGSETAFKSKSTCLMIDNSSNSGNVEITMDTTSNKFLTISGDGTGNMLLDTGVNMRGIGVITLSFVGKYTSQSSTYNVWLMRSTQNLYS